MIEVQGVSKKFGSDQVLDQLSFQVPNGQTHALIGLSGSGKTTALKLLCGLVRPDSGRIVLEDLPVDQEHLATVRAKIGYVIQDGGLFPHMTAEENLQLVGRECGWDHGRIQNRIAELATLTKLDPNLLKHFPRQLSGGQKQRVGLMRALLRDPPVLLLDEPLGALDPITRRDLQTEIRDLCRRLRKTVLLVTHDLYEAGFLASRILLLHKGRILQQGTLAELVRNPADAFTRRFVESQEHLVEGE